jgi:type IV pilus assembly protein PilA
MKKNNRKGFTIVELVIVIAVIAILAGVLIPTFSGIVEKAKKSAALQEAQNAYKEAYAIALSDDGKITAADNAIDDKETADTADDVVVGIEASGFIFKVSVDADDKVTWDVTEPKDFGYEVTIGADGVTVTE